MTDVANAAVAIRILERLNDIYPAAHCSLDHHSPFELLIATILSAQCTDIRVNQVTPELFKRYPDAEHLSRAELSDLEELVRSTGFYRHKARHLLRCAQTLTERHAGQVPSSLAELTDLPGVGRKTANVILGTAFHLPAMVVDTHVGRLAKRFAWTTSSQPEAIEKELCALLPEHYWIKTSHLLIYHGRAFCKAPTPHCSPCPLLDICPRCGVGKSI